MKIRHLFTVLGPIVLFAACNSPKTYTGKESVDEAKKSITEVLLLLQKGEKTDIVTPNWDFIKDSLGIPYTNSDSVLFLYKGDAQEVEWNGDFNGWGGDKRISNKGEQIAGTNIFYLKRSFPSDARIDYKVTVDGNWILDPLNKNVQWSGFGPNSELKMPKYQESEYNVLSSDAKPGNLSDWKLIHSKKLGYDLSYKVWLPANFDSESKATYPVLYVTDGQEYSDEKLGNLPVIASNLIALDKIEPLIIIFISPLNPKNPSENRRQFEYVMNPDYSAFLRDELVPFIDKTYPVKANRDNRGMLGTSLGGLHSAYIMSKLPEVFGKIGIHSPAFWFKPPVYELAEKQTLAPVKLFMSTGTISDTENDADNMKLIFDNKGWKYEYKKVNEGHSWGNWNGLMDETLISLFGL
ncbi:hypothetical protein EP331_04740 [bacterium]|nr:MAG: hypothetical protein EP331_04740 [bacterium]